MKYVKQNEGRIWDGMKEEGFGETETDESLECYETA
jgi:hypothetical protein